MAVTTQAEPKLASAFRNLVRMLARRPSEFQPSRGTPSGNDACAIPHLDRGKSRLSQHGFRLSAGGREIDRFNRHDGADVISVVDQITSVAGYAHPIEPLTWYCDPHQCGRCPVVPVTFTDDIFSATPHPCECSEGKRRANIPFRDIGDARLSGHSLKNFPLALQPQVLHVLTSCNLSTVCRSKGDQPRNLPILSVLLPRWWCHLASYLRRGPSRRVAPGMVFHHECRSSCTDLQPQGPAEAVPRLRVRAIPPLRPGYRSGQCQHRRHGRHASARVG